MALPKRKISKSRRDKRRTHWTLSAPSLMECPQCHQPKLTHRACPNCGHYNKREAYFPKMS
ncbi:50S ribosomal protein L32 [candidate division KSB1 bacterium]